MKHIEKYIDAKKLIAEINERLMDVNLEKLGNFGSHRVWAYNDVKDIICSLQQEQPSLPTNLDEVAEKYANRGISSNADPYEETVAYQVVKDAFKDGAEWMAGHGEVFDGIVRDDGFVDFDKYGSSMMIPSNTSCFNNGDKVKIIIVKEEK